MKDLEKCICGSGKPAKAIFDKNNVFVFFTCENCDKWKREQYDPCIFKNTEEEEKPEEN